MGDRHAWSGALAAFAATFRPPPWSLVPGLRDLRHYRREDARPTSSRQSRSQRLPFLRVSGWPSSPGSPVVVGLYATMLPLVGYALFGSSRQLVVGPEGTLAALTAVTIAPLAGGDPAEYAALAAALALVMGVILVLGGLLRLGFMADFFSKPVLLGYINGTALTIIATQLGKLFG